MKHKTTYFLFLAVMLMMVSMNACNRDNKKPRKEDSSGGTLELLIITDNKEQWNRSLGDTLRNYFGKEQTTLPQPEPLFTLVQLEAEGFAKMFQHHHNILILSQDPKAEKALIETRKDLWAAPQRVIKVTAPSYTMLTEEVDKHKEIFRDLFLEVEYERTDKTNRTLLESKIMHTLVNDLKLSLNIPIGYKLASRTGDFIWIRKETLKEGQGIFLSFEPYSDTNQFSPDNIILRRNHYTMSYVPGPSQGSFMTTALANIQPTFNRIELNGTFAVETRGIWETIGDYMGGPFVSYTLVDEKHNRLVTIEGYVYAPNAPKTLLLHQVDAICRTIRFVE